MSSAGKNENDTARVFVGDTVGPEDFAAVFEEQNRAGCLYLLDRRKDSIVKHLVLYRDPDGVLAPEEMDVRVFWSKDGTKCGVTIWGRMRGIIDALTGRVLVAALDSRDSEGITDPEWLKGFDLYLPDEQFIRARQRYWREKSSAQTRSSDSQDLPVETNFIVYESKNDVFAVFEDEGETGYLYAYTPNEQTILRYLHVYTRSERVDVTRADVQVVWSESGTKCGVAIWGKMRGIIDLTKDKPGRVWLESHDSPGIDDPDWLSGF